MEGVETANGRVFVHFSGEMGDKWLKAIKLPGIGREKAVY